MDEKIIKLLLEQLEREFNLRMFLQKEYIYVLGENAKLREQINKL